jgi:hypothetical protein
MDSLLSVVPGAFAFRIQFHRTLHSQEELFGRGPGSWRTQNLFLGFPPAVPQGNEKGHGVLEPLGQRLKVVDFRLVILPIGHQDLQILYRAAR